MPNFRGYPACECLAAWLPVYERMLKARKVLGQNQSLRIYQLIGGAPQSGGTHSTGGAFDLLDLPGSFDLRIARDMGGEAWSRKRNWDGKGGIEHIHGVLRGCPHNGPARYQIDALDAGYNGLGFMGRAGLDDGPRPLAKRTWQQGIAWAKQQLNQEEDMPITDDDMDKIARRILDAPMKSTGKDDWDSPAETLGMRLNRISERAGRGLIRDREIATAVAALRGEHAGLQTALKALAAGQKIDYAKVKADVEKATRAGLAEVFGDASDVLGSKK